MILVFDLCGTIVEYDNTGSSWQKLAEIISENALERQNNSYIRWSDGEYESYEEWAEDTIRIHLEEGIQKKHMEKLKEKMVLKNGFEDLIEEFNDQNKYIITGSFKNICNELDNRYVFNDTFATCEYLFLNDEIEYKINPYGSRLGKVRAFERIKIENSENQDVIFFGNGSNDIEIAKLSDLSFSIGDNEELNQIVDHKIQDFNESIEIIERTQNS